jgi:glycosyltransferase involved in cell wall biosynthesis
MPPRVSVIIPARNGGAFLAQAVESVVGQTYPDWEVVIADDASVDDTRHVAKQLSQRHAPRVRWVGLDRNVGPALARRAAIDASSGGELLALLDADDHWRPDYLAVQVQAYERALSAGRRPGIMACDAVIEDDGGKPIGIFSKSFGWIDPIDYDGMIQRSYIFVSAVFTRAAYEEVGGFSGECWGSEDYDLWLRIMEAGYDVVATREPIAYYRYHAAGLSRSQLTMADAALAAYRRALCRGRISDAQRRSIRGRVRHYRALRSRAQLRVALANRRPLGVARAALRAAPYGAVAFLQDPSRWGEWLGGRVFRRKEAEDSRPAQ